MLVSSFPPARHANLRVAKFAKYLPRDGWTPVILTAREPTDGRQQSSGTEFQDLLVWRTRWVSTPSTVASALIGAVRGRRAESRCDTAPDARDGSTSRIVAAMRQALVWGDTPDALAGWIPFAAARGWWLARKCGVSAIYASGPPFSVVCAGALLSQVAGLPYVVDFRDPWTLDGSNPIGTLTSVFNARVTARRLTFLRALEHWVIHRSSALLFTSAVTQQLYTARYPEIKGKSHTIYNGVDLDDFRGVCDRATGATITHAGTLHDFQWDQVQCFLGAFGLAVRSGMVPANTEVVFVGAIGTALRDRLEAAVRRAGIGGCVKVLGFVPHGEAVRWMRASRVLLAFAGREPHYFRLSKISEYLAAGAPIFAFAARESQTAQEIGPYGGRVISDLSENDVATALAEVMSRPMECGEAVRMLEHPHPLNRRTEAQYLSQILRGLAKP